jgi:hypothetical protein
VMLDLAFLSQSASASLYNWINTESKCRFGQSQMGRSA